MEKGVLTIIIIIISVLLLILLFRPFSVGRAISEENIDKPNPSLIDYKCEKVSASKIALTSLIKNYGDSGIINMTGTLLDKEKNILEKKSEMIYLSKGETRRTILYFNSVGGDFDCSIVLAPR